MPHCGGRDEQDTIPVLENLRSGENSSLDAHELGHLIYHSQMAELQFACMAVRVGLWRKLSAKELMVLNCGVGEDS